MALSRASVLQARLGRGLGHAVEAARRQDVVLAERRAAIIAAAVHENGADEDELAHAGRRRGARQVQRAGDVDVAVELDRVLFVLVMHARGEMDDGVDAFERRLPIGIGADRFDHDLVVDALRAAHRAADRPSLARQRGRDMTADEAARTRHQHDRFALAHRCSASSGLRNNSSIRPA